MNKLALLAVLWLVPATTWADVRITMHDGVVSITAKDATLRQILAEWARVGQTTIVNADQVSGGPLSLQIVDLPEAQALDVVLRTVSGYVAAPRRQAAANLSRFDRILITPTSAPVASAPARTPPPQGFPAGRVQTPVGDGDDDAPPPNAPPPAPPLGPRTPTQPVQVPRTFPIPSPVTPPANEPPPADPNGGPSPNSSPAAGAPIGVSVPGMVVQPPAAVQPGPSAPTGR